MKYALLFLLTCFFCQSCNTPENHRVIEENENDSSAIVLPTIDSIISSIQIDPGFRYYQNRSVESIAEELALNGYHVVHYFVTNENIANGDLINALHKEGIEVWLLTFGNGTYSTVNYPAGWQNWKMTLKESINGASGYTYLSPFNREFVEWKKEKLVNLVTSYPFDGIGIAEAYLPEWQGPNGPNYGDIGINAANAFYAAYGLAMPDFKNTSALNYYANVPDVYNKWIQFRVDGVNQFLNEIYNGPGGIRENRPDIKIATWGLGINAGNNSIDLLREYQGLDIPTMIKKVKPDLHFIQTHWPDWIKENLLPSYVLDYNDFLQEVKNVNSKLPVGIQTDIGSIKNMIRSNEWIKKFAEYSAKCGFDIFTAYEYHLGGYIYEDPPKILKALRIGENCVQLSFNKRIAIQGSDFNKNFRFFQNQKEVFIRIEKVETDGNRIRLFLKNQPKDKYIIQINNIQDTPDLWFYPGFGANQIQPDTKIEING